MGTNPCRLVKRQMLYGVFVFLLLANGLNADSCNVGCSKSDSGKLKYLPGNVYTYNFDSLVSVGVSGLENDDTSLKVVGQAQIFAGDNCAYTLKLDNVSVTAVRESLKKPFANGISKPVQFSLTNGELEPQICADKSDNQHSLNVKRAIISLLQSTDKQHETDVFGVCPTFTSTSHPGNTEIITKIRNLNKCGYREQISGGLVSGVVNERAGVKSSFLLDADYAKEQKLVDGIFQHIELNEEYKFAGLSKTQAGAKAKVKTVLKLTGQAPGAAPAVANAQSQPIIFHQPHNIPVKNFDALKKALETTIARVDSYVKPDAAKDFAELIRLMRSADLNSLIELSGVPHPNKVLARKVYLDALFRTHTPESVQAIIRQISKMSDLEKKIAFLSFNLVEHVSKEALNQAAGVLNGNTPKEAYLAVGNLVNKFCQHEGCEHNEVNVISKKFTDALRHCKATTKKDEDRIVYILRGIRNTHKIADASVATLIECASADRVSRIRVAAIQAFSAASCNKKAQEKALALLKDHSEDSEIRIEAYLALIGCPSAELATQLDEILKTETVRQVGGFITSNLKVIRDSTDESRAAARYYLGNIRLTKQFPIDPRRFSVNSEVSYSSESLGYGASADYNLIYSLDGFLPRSARLNATAEIFGRNFNVFELSARQENLERILEYYLGPKGFLRQEPKDILGAIASKSPRHRRSISDEANKFADKYKSYGSKINKDVNLDLSLRLFGSEFFFLSLGDNIPTNVDEVSKVLANALHKLTSSVKGYEKTFESHSLFFDSQLAYPTGSGFPLKLTAQGIAATRLEFGIEADLDEIFKNKANAKARVKFVPSVDVSLNGFLGVDALVWTTGVRVSSNLNSATGSDTRVQLTTSPQGFNVELDLPRENLQLIELKHNVEFVVGEQDKELRAFELKNKKKRLSSQENVFDQLKRFGLTVSYTASLPDTDEAAADFPLVGPVHIAVGLQVEKKITLQGSHTLEPTHQTWKLVYDTPGSKAPHNTALSLEVGAQEKVYARLAFEHPEAHYSAEVGLKKEDKDSYAYMMLEQDDRKQTTKIGFTKNGNEYKPFIHSQGQKDVRDDIFGYKAEGRVLVEGEKYNFDNLRLIRPKGAPIVVNGWVENIGDGFKSELKITDDKNTLDIESFLTVGPVKGYSIGMFVKDGQKTTGASGWVKLGDKLIESSLVVKAVDMKVELKSDFQFERDASNAVSRAKFHSFYEYSKGSATKASLKVEGETNNDLTHVQFEGLRAGKKATANFRLASNQRAPGDFELDVNGKLNKHFVDLKVKADVKGNKFLVDSNLVASTGTHIEAKGEVGQRWTQTEALLDLHGTIQLTTTDKPTTWVVKVVGTPDKTNSELKVTRENADWIVYSGEWNHPLDKPLTGKLNLQLKDYLVAKGDFKLNKNGKGDLAALLNFKKAGHKVKVDSKFNVAAPKYDLEANLQFDNDKKIFVKTENIVDRTKFKTKNVLELGGDKFLFDASGNVKGEWKYNGATEGSFSLTLPGGRQIEGALERKMTTAKNGLIQGTLSSSLTDKPAAGQQQSLSVSQKIKKFNPKTSEYSTENHLVYTALDGKKFELNNVANHLPKGHFKTIEFTLATAGELMPGAYNLNINVDEYCPKHAIFRINGKYTGHFDFNLNGKYNVAERAKPASYELQANIELPNAQIKKYTLATSGKLLKPQTEGGLFEAEFHFDQALGDKKYKLDTSAQGNRKHGSYKFSLDADNLTPLKSDGAYNREVADEKNSKTTLSLNCEFGDKFLKTQADVSVENADSVNLHASLKSSHDKLKNFEWNLKAKKSEEDTYSGNTQLKINDESYGLNSVIYLSKPRHGADITVTTPTRTSKLYAVHQILGERKVKWDVVIENFLGHDNNFKYTLDADFNNFEDYHIVIDADSPKLKLNQAHLDIHTQPESNGKAVVFEVKDAKQVILSGTAQYLIKKEKNKVIVEGQGQVQYMQKQSNANFKIVHNVLEQETDGETGAALTFNGSFGPVSSVYTAKLTNKKFHIKSATCEEKKQCTNLEIKSIVETPDAATTTHELMMLVDLREMGYPHEFELQSKTNRHGLLFEQELEASLTSNNNKKYQLLSNIKPLATKLQLKMPSREIALETTKTVPENWFGHYENSIYFYFDKLNKPNQKTGLVFSTDLTGVEKKAINAKGVLKFEHPSIRPLSLTASLDANRDSGLVVSELDLDIFKSPEHKIVLASRYESLEQQKGFNYTTEQTIKSAGLGLDYGFSGHVGVSLERVELTTACAAKIGSDVKLNAHAFGSRENFEVLIGLLGEDVLNVKGDLSRNKLKSKVNSKLQILGSKPLRFSYDFEPNRVVLSVKRDGLLDASGELKVGKEAKFEINGSGKKLYAGRVALDAAHFLTTSFEKEDDHVKEFLKNVKSELAEDTKAAREHIEKRFEKIRSEGQKQAEKIAKSAPEFQKISEDFENNLKAILDELESDPTLKAFIESYKKALETIIRISGIIAESGADAYKKLYSSVFSLYENIQKAVQESVAPALKEFITKVSAVISDLTVEIAKLLEEYVDLALKNLKEFENELKAIGKPLAETLKPLVEGLIELSKVLNKEWESFLDDLKEYWLKLPTFDQISEEIKARFAKLKLVDEILTFLGDALVQFEALQISPDLYDFLKKLLTYTEAKLKDKSVNDTEALKELYESFITVARSVFTAITGQEFSTKSLLSNFPLTLDALSSLPTYLSFEASPLNYLRNEGLEGLKSSVGSVRPIYGLLPPYALRGHLIDGKHVFTFDGVQFTFPGNGQFILAQDAADKNFTVLATLKNGHLKTITLVDKKNFVEVGENGAISINGKPTEYPVHVEDLHAWRNYYTFYLKSQYGATVMCTANLKVCHVEIDGFYTSKTRGLLGIGNSEPSSDFTLPDGSVADNYAKFVNAYSIGKSTPVNFEDQSTVPSDELCSELFSLESPLVVGYLFENPELYRKACNIAVQKSAHKQEDACSIAFSYASALNYNRIPVEIPSKCVKCNGSGEKAREIGEEHTMKLPGNKADVVFLVDTGSSKNVLANLVTPAIAELPEQLKARGITDVQIAVIAYNMNEKYPALLTSNGGKLHFNGKLDEINLNGPKNTPFEFDIEKLDFLIKQFQRLEQGLFAQPDESAFNLASNYPYRTGATKSLIIVRSSALQYGNALRYTRALFENAFTQMRGVLMHLITPVDGLLLEGAPSDNIVGFNSRLIARIEGKDAKKRPKLKYRHDMGIDFIVNDGGWVFDSKNFDAQSSAEQKKAYLNQIVTSLADNLFKTEMTVECECSVAHGLYGRNECTVISQNFVPNKKVKA